MAREVMFYEYFMIYTTVYYLNIFLYTHRLPCYHPSAYAKSRDEGATSYAGMTSSGNGTTAANPTPTTSSPRSAGGGIGHSTSSASSDSGNGADVSPSSDYVPPGVREYMDGVIGSAVTSGGELILY
jgi:hypothetical protein